MASRTASKWWSGRAVALHATVVVVVVAFCLLARWQVDRALSGNTLSWAYAFEWPFFALYALYMWWKLLDDDGPARPARRRTSRADADEEEAERQRVAYNRYLQSLAEGGRGTRSA